MRPWQLLPAPEPCTVSPPEGHFYDTVAKHLIKDTVRLMHNGLPIDMSRVKELEATLDVTLAKVADDLATNPIVRDYLSQKHIHLTASYRAEQESKLKPVDFFLKPFDSKKPDHRSYFMHVYTKGKAITQPTDLLPTGIPKWNVKDVKSLSTDHPALALLLAGKISPTNTYAISAMQLYAEHKAEIHNRKYLDNIANLTSIEFPKFNPASPDQKHDILTDMLGYESEKLTDAYIKYERALNVHIKYGKPEPVEPKNKFSWDRDNIEALKDLAKSDDELSLFQSLIDYSTGSIIKNNFINAFYLYTINGRLYGNLKLFGTKTFRLTSSGPNLLNMPSTGSKFAKPIKKCFKASEGKIILAIDYSALENRVIANLAKEQTLIKLYEDDLDGHCVNSLYYFREEISKYIELTGDLSTDAKLYASKLEEIPELKAIRQKGKGPSFGLQYGAYPAKVASSIKCTLEEAETIFNRYHNELYPSVTRFRESYVLPTAIANKKLHIGLGCYIKSSNPSKDIRTITNSCSQFWSILTLLTINELHHHIDEWKLQDHIKIISTIYDSIYIEITDEAPYIEWVNNMIVPIMEQPFIEGQVTQNQAVSDIGYDWATMISIPPNASLEEIDKVRKILKEK